MMQEKIATLTFVVAALSVMILGWLTRASLPVSLEIGKPLGIGIFLTGMVGFAWTLVHLKKAFLGDVAPLTDRLIIQGPYRWVRHPLYFCMLITYLGIGIVFRSLWGIISIPVLFLPAVVYRARLEEIALLDKFGNVWEEYLTQTRFLIPFLW